MLKIGFYPVCDMNNVIRAAEEYRDIWAREGEKIVATMEDVSGLKFKSKFFNALVLEGRSQAFPLLFRASYPTQFKKGYLIHELNHRLLGENGINQRGFGYGTRGAEQVERKSFLVLYDIWISLYGKGFAEENVKDESERHVIYRKAWKWALGFDREERKKEFLKLVAENG